ncbi:MAG: hypothetical protein B6I26_03690 [Desulfobacteraceae bacterium 4572_130]|nr:MAG: hypothetical protein B6I26_03690 [Desulfobacteraceae bacterium 4572_130]
MNHKDGDIDILYKYRDLDEKDEEKMQYVERIFSHNELYFSNILDFNDPFDCKPHFSSESTDKEFKDYLFSKYHYLKSNITRQQKRAEIRTLMKDKQLKENMARKLEDDYQIRISKKIGVLCLSAISDNILMWSHYAGSHSGICIEFEATSYTEFFGLADKVDYEKDYPVVNIIKDAGYNMAKKVLLTKSKDWKYEKEWRIINKDAPPGSYKFPSGFLKGVILGAKIGKNKEKVLSWVKKSKHPIKVYQAKLKKYEYGLDIKLYNEFNHQAKN